MNKNFENSIQLANIIKNRRLELKMTIEEAARGANVGTKTWSRYEAGNPIRNDKIKGVLRVLKWSKIPGEKQTISKEVLVEKYKAHEAWSNSIEENYGLLAAISFCIGSDLLIDYVNEDINELSKMPKLSHIGQIENSSIYYYLPEEFLMEYDYNFLFKLKICLNNLIKKAVNGTDFVAHKPIEEILLKAIVESSEILMEEIFLDLPESEFELIDRWDDWIYEMFGDIDVITFLYSDLGIGLPDEYNFNNWFKDLFYMNK